MKANKIGPLAFLAVGTLVLALLLQMAGRGVLPRGSRAGALTAAEILVTDPMTGAETLQFYEDRQGIDADTAQRFLGAKVDSFADDATVVVSVPLQTSSAYAPYLDLYCQVDGDGPDWSILSIYSVQLCGTEGDTRPFAGDISVFLRGDREIEYIVNGDFFRKGTMEADRAGRVDIMPGGSAWLASAIRDGDPDEEGDYCYQNRTVKL